jgi:hypothetical protein
MAMNEKRFGRFVLGTYNDDNITVALDHANGMPQEYQLPFMSTTDAEDLIYGLQQYVRSINERRTRQQ